MRTITLDFYTQYNQFFLIDKDAVLDHPEEMWPEQAFQDKLAMLPGWLSIGTGCYGPVKGVIRVLEQEPELQNISTFDHVVEGSIKITSGIIELIPCTSNEAEHSIGVAPGYYRVRISSAGLNTVDGDEGNDFYELDIWSATFKNREVLKRY